MTNLRVEWLTKGRKAQCPPNPDFPNGKDIDITEGQLGCSVALPYPAECCGMFMVVCTACGLRVGVTAAGRPDDPKSVKVPCKMERPAQ